ncbi:cytochrome P450 [Streptomyces sp. NPDC052415]|uniref:cytochrome P450 n=1 Tax=Streptomyces sp. NPDC052415 TaxID=3365690 RepID=UPI0037D1D32D
MAAALSRFQRHLVPNLYWRTVAPRWTDLLPVPGFSGARRRVHTAVQQATQIDNGDADDVLSQLCRARYSDTDAPLEDKQILHEMLFYLSAGAHGAADVLPWLFHELARHPQIEARVHQEIDTVLAGRGVGTDDLPRLQYTRQVLMETLRLYPPVWILGRRTSTDVNLGGHHLPDGTDLAFSPYAMHRHPRYFPRPDTFDPDRWTPGRSDKLPPGAYIPFGTGPRKCIGDRMAVNQILTAAATIASYWRLRPQPGARIRAQARVFLKPENVLMVCEPRTAPA